PLLHDNAVRVLRDARENYPAWLAAIHAAEHHIHFESYIIHEDAQGQIFAEALMARARAGVQVRVIYDWMGALTATSGAFWRRLRAAGIEVRCFNQPRWDSPLGWLGRDHRKLITIDGRIGFVMGLCVGSMWAGNSENGLSAWRDTGIEIQGPAVAELERSFARMWALTGTPLPPVAMPEPPAPAGNVALRVVASQPNMAGLYRLDQMIAATARRNLWLTDAYFAGTTPYVQALCSAAQDGVDVRLLVPHATDLPIMRALSRVGYRPLLEAGVRVYEWNGAMLHAKTAVADGRWARVGSSNLNLASWIANWELDVVIEDQRIGGEMEQMYLDDLAHATEIVLTARRRMAPVHPATRRRRRLTRGSSGRAAAGAIEVSRAVGAALTNHRLLGPAEARIMAGAATFLLALSLTALQWPRVFVVPAALFSVWMALALYLRAYRLHRDARREERREQASDQGCAPGMEPHAEG
ncbi:MAG: phospholipase D-like domain-containing protein, partial [Blastocatellia bacterium]